MWKELFKVLDYLRDGESFAIPTETDAREALRKEAEFYNIPDLAKMCVFDVDVFKVGDWVQWRDEVIEEYWKYFVRYQIRSNKAGRDHLRCMACGYFAYGYVGPTGTTMAEQQKSGLPIIYEDWLLLKHHMRTMKGIVSEVRKGKHRRSEGRVRINVGGTVFETTIATLTRLDNTMLSALVSHRWNQSNQRAIFVDRNPAYFGKERHDFYFCVGTLEGSYLFQVLDYLRDGENFALPIDHEARESLRREAEFYNLPGLVEMCSPTLQVGDCVQWTKKAIEACWKWHVRYECNGRKSCPTSKNCGDYKACGSHGCECAGYKASNRITQSINYDDWISLKHEMKYMKGSVRKIIPKYCCHVKWDNGWNSHLRQSALRLATSE